MSETETAPDEVRILYGEQEFVLGPPSTDVVLRILNVIGSLGVRSERAVTRLIDRLLEEGVEGAAVGSLVGVAFSLLAVLNEADLLRLGSAVLQFEVDREGRQWIREQGVKIKPIIEALFANFRLCGDLAEGLGAFLEGIPGLGPLIENLAGEEASENPEEDGEDADDTEQDD